MGHLGAFEARFLEVLQLVLGEEPATNLRAVSPATFNDVQAAIRGEGVALAPSDLCRRELDGGQLVRPFSIDANVGGYWLTWLKSRTPSAAMRAFRDWLRSVFPDSEGPPAQPLQAGGERPS